MDDFEDIEKKIKDIGRETTPDTDKRILDDALASLGQVPRTHPAPVMSTLIPKVAVTIMVIVVVVGLVFIFTKRAQTQKKIAKPPVFVETTPKPPEELTVSELETAEPIHRERTVEQLQKELEHITILAQDSDVNELLAVLNEGSVPAKMLAAGYLAQIGDLDVAEILEDLAAELAPDDPNNVFAVAASQIKARYRESFVRSEPADDIEPKVETEPVEHDISGWLINPNGQPINGMVQIGLKKVTANAEDGFTMSKPVRKEFMSSFGRAYDANGQMGCFFIWRGDEDTNNLEVIVKPFAAVTGTVIDFEAEAVDDFDISIKPYVEDEMVYESSIGEIPWKSTVHKDGTFEVNSIPVGVPLGLVVTKPGFKTQIKLDLTAGRTLDLNDVVLESLPGFHESVEWNCRLEGYILDENNEPLVGVSVGAFVGEERFKTVSDSLGWYEFRNLPNDVITQIVPYFDGYGNNLFGYDRTDCNNRLDIQIFPQAYDWYDQPAPSLLVRTWLNSEELDIQELTGKVVLLCLGLDCSNGGDCLNRPIEIYQRYSEQNDFAIIAVHEYLEPNSQTEDALLEFIEQQQIDFPVAVDQRADAAKDFILPEHRRLEGEHISVRKRGINNSGATHSIYQVRQRPAYFLIDRAGMLRASVAVEDLYESIDQLLAE
jgi:hypothetical protein